MDFWQRYRAIDARDTRFDGQFYTAVRTTGIYCRPSCPARTPKAANVTFYETSAAAHDAGYRACKRCLPEAVPGTPAWNVRQDLAGRAMRLINDGVINRDGVEGLAARLGYSARQLNRILSHELGAGPLSLARASRAQTARTLLVSTSMKLADIAFASGFSSVRQFNETMVEVFAMTPTALRSTARHHKPGHGRHLADADPALPRTVRSRHLFLPRRQGHPRDRGGDTDVVRPHVAASARRCPLQRGLRRRRAGTAADPHHRRGGPPRPAGPAEQGAPAFRPRRRSGGDRQRTGWGSPACRLGGRRPGHPAAGRGGPAGTPGQGHDRAADHGGRGPDRADAAVRCRQRQPDARRGARPAVSHRGRNRGGRATRCCAVRSAGSTPSAPRPRPSPTAGWISATATTCRGWGPSCSPFPAWVPGRWATWRCASWARRTFSWPTTPR